MRFSTSLALVSSCSTLAVAVKLNIVAAGASITYGVMSSHGNGYRDDMLYSLQRAGHEVQMIGTRSGGDCYQPWSEGYPGFAIDKLKRNFTEQFSKFQSRPNVIVTLIGTNDQRPGAQDIAGAPGRFNGLLAMYQHLCPDCVIVASTLPPNGNQEQNNNINGYNAAIRNIIGGRRAAGQHILLNDGNGGLTVAGEMASDQYHPNDRGYQIIGQRMAEQIKSAIAMGWTKAR